MFGGAVSQSRQISRGGSRCHPRPRSNTLPAKQRADQPAASAAQQTRALRQALEEHSHRLKLRVGGRRPAASAEVGMPDGGGDDGDDDGAALFGKLFANGSPARRRPSIVDLCVRASSCPSKVSVPDPSSTCELDLRREDSFMRMRSAAEKLVMHEPVEAPSTAQDSPQREGLPQRRLSRQH